MENYHTAIIGSGINSLVAAALLARAGKTVLVLEKNERFGGNIRTEEITLPGFKHDVFSCWHPLFVTSPGYALLKDELHALGLKYLNTDTPTGVIHSDGSHAVLTTSRERNIAAFNRIHAGEGDRYDSALKEFGTYADLVFGLLSAEPFSWQALRTGARGFFRYGIRDTVSLIGKLLPNGRRWLDDHFDHELIKTLFAPWLLHAGLSPDDAGGAVMTPVMMASLEQAGMPIPEGGGYQLADCLVQLATQYGATFRNNAYVDHILVENKIVKGVTVSGEIIGAKHVLASVTPNALYQQLLPPDSIPHPIASQSRYYQYGRADMQLHFALDQPLNWPEALRSVPIVHICDSLRAYSKAANEALNGYLPVNATIVVGQPTVLDPSRAPEGKHIVWIQLQEMPNTRNFQGDAAGEIATVNGYTREVCEAYAQRIINRIEQVAPGFRNSILDWTFCTPADLEAYNPNLVGGDPYSGISTVDQLLFWRPLPDTYNHHTPIKHLYHIGASTHPGAGLSGTSGYLAAKALLP